MTGPSSVRNVNASSESRSAGSDEPTESPVAPSRAVASRSPPPSAAPPPRLSLSGGIVASIERLCGAATGAGAGAGLGAGAGAATY